MQDFEFCVPTKIIFGKGKEKEIGQVLKGDNVKKVLMVYGSGSIKKSGLYDVVTDSLKSSGITFVEYGGVKSNPRVSDVNEAVKIAMDEDVEAILGVGGGSVMDTVKGVAAAAKRGCDVWDFSIGKTPIEEAFPIYNIVTLAATASEMNMGFVLTNEDTREKLGFRSPLLYPKLSILNPELTYSVPKDYTAYGAVDIVAHVLEAYLTRTEGPLLMSMYIESIIKTVMRTTAVILDDPENYDARAEFMWSATLALNGTALTGMGGASLPNHMLEHGVSAISDIPHGAGLSIVIPAWMRWYSSKNEGQFIRFAKEIFGQDTIEGGIEELEKWFKSIGSPTRLNEVDIDDSILPDIVKKAHKQAQTWGIDGNYSPEDIAEILELAK
jgi:alcohol dehydrogenase YqhD (iron-dependent ADH family)